jgi:hypothetical protein
LRLIAAMLAQIIIVLLGLDTLPNDSKIEPVPDGQNRFGNGLTGAIMAEMLDEGLINFEAIEW